MQSRQNVQSMFPVLRGLKSASSQPRWITTSSGPGSRRPRIQSLVRQLVQTSLSRILTSSGESVEATKLNCPMGQTNLQNEACLKKPSTTSAPRKYAMISDAVHHGADHKSKSS